MFAASSHPGEGNPSPRRGLSSQRTGQHSPKRPSPGGRSPEVAEQEKSRPPPGLLLLRCTATRLTQKALLELIRIRQIWRRRPCRAIPKSAVNTRDDAPSSRASPPRPKRASSSSRCRYPGSGSPPISRTPSLHRRARRDRRRPAKGRGVATRRGARPSTKRLKQTVRLGDGAAVRRLPPSSFRVAFYQYATCGGDNGRCAACCSHR